MKRSPSLWNEIFYWNMLPILETSLEWKRTWTSKGWWREQTTSKYLQFKKRKILPRQMYLKISSKSKETSRKVTQNRRQTMRSIARLKRSYQNTIGTSKTSSILFNSESTWSSTRPTSTTKLLIDWTESSRVKVLRLRQNLNKSILVLVWSLQRNKMSQETVRSKTPLNWMIRQAIKK